MALLDRRRLVHEAQLELQAQSVAFAAMSAPLSILYGAAQALRASLYDSGIVGGERLPGRVVSVGNLVAGGTGKTPVVIAVARWLATRGRTPAILTRGYGATRPPGTGFALLAGALVPGVSRLFLDHADGTALSLPDEARLMSVALPEVPVLAHASRAAAARAWLARGEAPSDWLLDDGFQHRQLARDADLVLLDARHPFGNGKLLPRGTLREPVAALRRAKAVLFTRAAGDFPSAAARRIVADHTAAPVFTASFHTEIPPEALGRGPILLATGIAHPERLRTTVENIVGAAVSPFFVPDHAAFDLETLRSAAGPAAVVLTTAKDHWRDPALFARLAKPVFIVDLRVSGVEELCQTLFGDKVTSP